MQQSHDRAVLSLEELKGENFPISKLKRTFAVALTSLPLDVLYKQGRVAMLNKPQLKKRKQPNALTEDDRTGLLSFLTEKNAQAIARSNKYKIAKQ